MYHSRNLTTPVSPSTELGPSEELPLPLLLEDGAVYEVKEILDSRRCDGQLEYMSTCIIFSAKAVFHPDIYHADKGRFRKKYEHIPLYKCRTRSQAHPSSSLSYINFLCSLLSGKML